MLKKLSIEKILTGISIGVLLWVAGLATYDKCYQQDYTVVVRLNQNEDPFVKLPQVMPTDSAIRNVREIDRTKNEYVLTVTTRKKKKDLLDWILGRSGVEDAHISQ